MVLLFSILGQILYWGASAALMVLFVRLILDWIVFFSPTWRPGGPLLILANVIYAVTDPPLLYLRRLVPPLRFGGTMALDIGFLLLFVGLSLLMRVGTWLWLMGQ